MIQGDSPERLDWKRSDAGAAGSREKARGLRSITTPQYPKASAQHALTVVVKERARLARRLGDVYEYAAGGGIRWEGEFGRRPVA